MFGELGKKLVGWFGSREPQPQPEVRPAAEQRQEGGEASHPKSCKPWEDRTLSAAERYQSYYDVVRAKCEAIRDAGNQPGITAAERYKISQDPEANFWVDEFRQLKGESPEAFCQRVNEAVPRELLGKNFLGAEAWAAQGIDVGAVPPLPVTIAAALLNSECPLHPGQKIKDTHLLVLVPKTVNGEPYSALKLRELCATRKGSGEKLILEGDTWGQPRDRWIGQPWAVAPQAESEWVLLPQSDPNRRQGDEDQHFRDKTIAEQDGVHRRHYTQYRVATALEIMTAAVLLDLTNRERMLPDSYLRCQESGGSVSVGRFVSDGLAVYDDHYGDGGFSVIGRALARKLTA